MFCDHERAIAEIALIHSAIQIGMPIFAICGGHQLLNVYFGGKLAFLYGDEFKSQPLEEFSTVIFSKSMFWPQIEKAEEREYYGAHYEYVSHIGGEKFLEVIAKSKDGKVEACEAKFGVPILSVQFHPEFKDELGMINSFKKSINAYHYKKTMLVELKNSPRFFKAIPDPILIESDASDTEKNKSVFSEPVTLMQVCMNRKR